MIVNADCKLIKSPQRSAMSSALCIDRFGVGVVKRFLHVKLSCLLQDQPLGNWRLKRQVDDGDEVIYKFSPKFVLKAGQSVTVGNMK